MLWSFANCRKRLTNLLQNILISSKQFNTNRENKRKKVNLTRLEILLTFFFCLFAVVGILRFCEGVQQNNSIYIWITLNLFIYLVLLIGPDEDEPEEREQKIAHVIQYAINTNLLLSPASSSTSSLLVEAKESNVTIRWPLSIIAFGFSILLPFNIHHLSV